MINKIALISDLHLDFWEHFYRQKKSAPTSQEMLDSILEKCKQSNPDLIVIAGDLHNGGHTHPILTKHDNFDTLLVPGNHDYYGAVLPTSIDYTQTDQLVATTLWTNFHGAVGSEAEIYAGIADNRAIKNTSAFKVQELCNNSWDLIKHLNREIIVTHFPPSTQSIARKYQGNAYNSYFVNNFDNEIIYGSLKSKLWMFGHVHHKHSYILGDLLCVANPLGYPYEIYKSIKDYQPTVIEKIDDQWRISN